MHLFRLPAVHGGFGLRQQRKGVRGEAFRGFVHAARGDERGDVRKRTVLVLGRQRDFRVPAADVVHLPPNEAHASGEIGQDGVQPRAQFRFFHPRHPQQPGEEHVPGQAGMRPDSQDRAAFRFLPALVRMRVTSVKRRMRVVVDMGMSVGGLAVLFAVHAFLVVRVRYVAHNPFTTLAAAQAAPYPLSIFMIPTPGAQLESMLASAALPPCAAP